MERQETKRQGQTPFCHAQCCMEPQPGAGHPAWATRLTPYHLAPRRPGHSPASHADAQIRACRPHTRLHHHVPQGLLLMLSSPQPPSFRPHPSAQAGTCPSHSSGVSAPHAPPSTAQCRPPWCRTSVPALVCGQAPPPTHPASLGVLLSTSLVTPPLA